MKKFLGKKAVMWSFLGAAIAFLVLYVCLLVRPVTTITPYKCEYMGQEMSYQFKGGNKLKVTYEGVGSEESWVAYDVYGFIQGPSTDSMTKDEFLDAVEDFKKADKEGYEEELVDVNAFRIKFENPMTGETVIARNVGAIVFAIVGGIVEAGLATFAVLSILTRKKKA